MARWIALAVCTAALAAEPPKGWVKGKGYGWIWGAQDEIGALNAIAGPEWVRRALAEVRLGRVYDLGVRVDRRSYKWPGHSPIEVMTFRSPHGVKSGKDIAGFAAHPRQLAFHSCALFISDNVGTQIDGLAHITRGKDDHWYNGFREQDHGGDFGVRKADADSIPPIVARGVLVDVAGWKGVDALPPRFAIGPKELQGALARQQTDVEPGDAVLIRTGTLRYWGETGADHERIAPHDSAGLTIEGARWLVAEKGAVLIASDTSGLEWGGDPNLPVHEYLLVEQGVHIGELFYLEELARDKAWRFALIVATNRIRGTTAGFALRPLALR